MKQDQIGIRYLAILSGQNQPILLKNLNGSEDEEHFLQINLLSSLDLIDLMYRQKQLEGLQNSYQRNQEHCYLGLVHQFDLNEQTLGVFSFITVTQFKILILLDINQEKFTHKIKDLLMDIYEIYKKECFSPFGNAQPFEGKMTLKFDKKIDIVLQEYNRIPVNQE